MDHTKEKIAGGYNNDLPILIFTNVRNKNNNIPKINTFSLPSILRSILTFLDKNHLQNTTFYLLIQCLFLLTLLNVIVLLGEWALWNEETSL
jgi:hypothetical protein